MHTLNGTFGTYRNIFSRTTGDTTTSSRWRMVIRFSRVCGTWTEATGGTIIGVTSAPLNLTIDMLLGMPMLLVANCSMTFIVTRLPQATTVAALLFLNVSVVRQLFLIAGRIGFTRPIPNFTWPLTLRIVVILIDRFTMWLGW